MTVRSLLFILSVVRLLRQHLVNALPHQRDFLVQDLGGIVPAYNDFPGKMYAGRLPTDNGEDRKGMMMFWMFVPNLPTVDDALIVWLNGGPGCSSFNAGVLFEHSPVTIPLHPAGYCCSTKNDPLVYNNYSWALAAPIMYVEQPVNVGFSEGGPEPENEDEVAGDFYAFLVNFFEVFASYKSKRLFMTGESYAGYFVPAISHKIYMENIMPSTVNSLPINLAGMAAGNGWMDASVQGPATIDYAYWHGMIDQNTRENLHAEWEHCMSSKSDEPEPDPFHKFNIPDDCAMMEAVLMAAGSGAFPENPDGIGPNTYDVTTWDNYPAVGHPEDGNNTFERFLNNPKVKDALHAPQEIYWRGCIPGAGRRLKKALTGQRRRRRQRRNVSSDDEAIVESDPSQTGLLAQDRPVSVPYVAELLDANIRVLIYNGDRDLSTNAPGSEQLLNDMDWKGADGWRKAPRGLWVAPRKQVAGYTKEHLALQFVVVYNSGHLVPYNQPAHALDLIVRFLKNQSFADYPLPSFEPTWRTDQPRSSSKSRSKSAHHSTISLSPNSSSSCLEEKKGQLLNVGTWLLVATAVIAFAAGYYMSWTVRKTQQYTRIGNAQ